MLMNNQYDLNCRSYLDNKCGQVQGHNAMFSLRDTGGAPLKCGSVEVGSQFLLRTDPFLALKHRQISCNL